MELSYLKVSRGKGKIYRMIDHCHWFLSRGPENRTVHIKYPVSKDCIDKVNLQMTFSELKLRTLRQASILSCCSLNKISHQTFNSDSYSDLSTSFMLSSSWGAHILGSSTFFLLIISTGSFLFTIFFSQSQASYAPHPGNNFRLILF